MFENLEKTLNKLFDYKWTLILLNSVLIVIFYIKTIKKADYNFFSTIFTTPEKIYFDAFACILIYFILMTIIVPVFRSSIAILIAYVSFLNKAYTEDDLRDYIKESDLLKISANEDNSVKYQIYLSHIERKRNNLAVRKLNLAMSLLIIFDWKQLTELYFTNNVLQFFLLIFIFIFTLVGIKPESPIDSTTPLRK